MGPKAGEVYVTRVFRDSDPRLRVFKLVVFLNLSIGVVDMEDPKNLAAVKGRNPEVIERVIWFSKSDLQFFDLIQPAPEAANNEKGN